MEHANGGTLGLTSRPSSYKATGNTDVASPWVFDALHANPEQESYVEQLVASINEGKAAPTHTHAHVAIPKPLPIPTPIPTQTLQPIPILIIEPISKSKDNDRNQGKKNMDEKEKKAERELHG